ncbi:MAG: electron transfer flavoprotein subunit beta/FixA family protein [Planctomycetota bacterium]|jgi:electron transfer flavoprotein beta subunit
MRTVVPIKQVPETNAVRMDEATGTMIREGVEAIVNPLDLYAIELAIRLRESDGGEVTAVSMGPPNAATALREAIAMGVDSGVLITDKAFAGSDTWATSYVLAAAIKKLGDYDLIICGERATDGDTGQVGPGIASFLDLPVLTYVSEIEDIAGARVRVRRLVEAGYEILESELPCVVTVVKEIASPRLPTLRGKQRARRTDLCVWGPDDLEVDAEHIGLSGSPTRVVKIFRPKVARKCRKVTATDEHGVDEAAESLVEFLRERTLLRT